MVNALAGRPIRPLWHLSGAGAVYANGPVNGTAIRTLNGTGVGAALVINLCGGTVAEWTIAAALKAAGRKARGFESLPFREGIRQATRPFGRVALSWDDVRRCP